VAAGVQDVSDNWDQSMEDDLRDRLHSAINGCMLEWDGLSVMQVVGALTMVQYDVLISARDQYETEGDNG
jgi:hypothetical protein